MNVYTSLTKDGLWMFVRKLNRLCAVPLDEAQLLKVFEGSYPEIETAIGSARKTLAKEPRRAPAALAARTPRIARRSMRSARGVVNAPASSVGRWFGEVLRQNRRQSGWSQQELASRSKVDRTFVSQIERGLRVPTITVVLRLASALQIGLTEIMEQFERRMEADPRCDRNAR